MYGAQTMGESGRAAQAMLERSVIASMIAGDALPSQTGLARADFTDALAARLFELMRRMEAGRTAIDLAGVCMEDETLDAAAVVELVKERCLSGVILEQSCERLRASSLRRGVIGMLQETIAGIQGQQDALTAVSALHERLGGVLRGGGGEQGRTMMELICELLCDMEKGGEADAPVACGVEKIDGCLCGGFRRGDLAVIAALTGVGKSAMLSFMMRSAAQQGRQILLVSCEMSDRQNAERFLASISGVEMRRLIRREALTQAENVRVSDGMAIYHPENIRVISSGTQSVASIRREALRMKAGAGLDLIVVDYLQRLRPERGAGSRAEEIGTIAAGLKSLAVDLDVPVLTAAQFNREAARARREAAGREDAGIPALHQLRDSSQIEDEANTVIILDEPQRKASSRLRRINAYIAKNRSGALGAVALAFDPATMCFSQVG